MKALGLLLATAIIFGSTSAYTSEINCKAELRGTILDFQFSSDENILDGPSKVKLTVRGMMTNNFILNLVPKLVIADKAIFTLETTARGVPDPIAITGEIEFALKGDGNPAGEATMNLRGVTGTAFPAILPLYELRDCVGRF